MEDTTTFQSLTSNAVRCSPLPRSTGSCTPDITPQHILEHFFVIHIVHNNSRPETSEADVGTFDIVDNLRLAPPKFLLRADARGRSVFSRA